MPGPEQMRTAVGRYVEEVHRAYLAQAETFAPAVRGRMPLLASPEFRVAAVAARNLHVLATLEPLGPLRGQEVEVPGELGALRWALRFYDPVVVPALGLIDESAGPAFNEVKHAVGLSTVLYHLVAQPGSGLSVHHAGHVGTGLASSHSRAARDFETIRSRVRGRERLVDELEGAAVAGLPRAQALLARAIAPRDAAVAAFAEAADPDPEAVRKALLSHVGGPSRFDPAAHDAAFGGTPLLQDAPRFPADGGTPLVRGGARVPEDGGAPLFNDDARVSLEGDASG